VSLTGPGVSETYERNVTDITLNSLTPGTRYELTVIQETGDQFPRNSSGAMFDFRTTSTSTDLLYIDIYTTHCFIQLYSSCNDS
jgi:hypothetical protein